MKIITFLSLMFLALGGVQAQESMDKGSKWQIMFNVNQSYSLEEVRDSKWSYPGVGFLFNKRSNKAVSFQTRIAYTKWDAYDISDSAMLMLGANYKLMDMNNYQLNYFLMTGIVGYSGGDTYTGVHSMSETGFQILPQSKNGINGGIYFSFFPEFFNSISVFAGYSF